MPTDPAAAGDAEHAPAAGWSRFALDAIALTLPLGIAAQQGALALLAVAFVLECVRARRVPRSPLDVPIALFFAALLVSTAFCPDPLRSLRAYPRLWIVVGFFATYHLARTRADVERVAWLTIASASVVAAYGVVQHYTGIDLAHTLLGKPPDVDPFWLGTGWRTKGLHPSGITYAHNVLFPLTFTTGYALAGSISPLRRATAGVGWCLMLLALVFSATRGVWLAFAVVLLIFGSVRGGARGLAALAGLLVLVLLLVGFDAGIRARARSGFDLAANVGRTEIWHANLDMARERPLLGWGYGSYKYVRQPFYDRYADVDTTAHAHNDYLQTLVDGGVLTLVPFLALFVVLVRAGFRGYRETTEADEPARSLALATTLAIVGFLVGGLTQYNFGDAEVVIYLWCTAGLVMRLATLAGR
jgi:O-antigen ligase